MASPIKDYTTYLCGAQSLLYVHTTSQSTRYRWPAQCRRVRGTPAALSIRPAPPACTTGNVNNAGVGTKPAAIGEYGELDEAGSASDVHYSDFDGRRFAPIAQP